MRKLTVALFFPVIAACLLLGATLPPLKTTDIRSTVEELLSYHVEYKEFSPLLIKRSFKSYIEQFDPQKLYLLDSEVQPYLELSLQQVEQIAENYYTDQFTEYEALNRTMVHAIERSKRWRKEIEAGLSKGSIELKPSENGSYFHFATGEQQLKDRMKDLLTRFLVSEDGPQSTPERRQKLLGLLEKRFNRMESNYLDQSDSEHFLTQHILKAIARSLDAHTAYFSPEEAFEMRASLEKQFEGIGVILKEGVDGVVIADLIKGGPAARSGQIQIGDQIVAVDGHSLDNASYEEVLQHLKGKEKRKEISIGLKRSGPNGKPKAVHVELRREKIVLEEGRLQYTAEPFADGIIGKLTLPSFYESGDGSSCELDMREAIRELKKKGKLLGVVLDLRENLGGFLDQAVKVAGLFITSGVVVVSKYARGQVQYLRHLDPRVYFNGPLLILTSKTSASAAEIVAQALQDYGTALVVGDERTYGKGTIQYQTVTDDHTNAFFKVTVGKYYTVSGISTQINGVQTDIAVPTAFAPYNIGERFLEYPLANDRIAASYQDPLSDLDPHSQFWFQQNYMPHLQKKESKWRKMLTTLQKNSALRIQKDPNFQLFLKQEDPLGFDSRSKKDWGDEDLQMTEAVSIVKDMIILQAPAA